MKKIIMTGGGTSGHITPNIALIPRLLEKGYDIHYIGSSEGLEKSLIEEIEVSFYSIQAGKLRRYFDFENVKDIGRIFRGFLSSISLMRKIKPNIVFSKGGYVATPVVWAAWLYRVPVVIHESDITPGLANRLSIPFSKKVCYAFPESKNHISDQKGIHTGLPIRKELLSGNKVAGVSICKFNSDKPIITIMGGSLGSKILNEVIRASLNRLLIDYQVCHICGKNNIDASLDDIDGYKQFEYINKELPDIFAMSDIFISRAGATTLFELLELKIPNILIPLSKKASRGDQILNADSFRKQGFSLLIEEENLDSDILIESLNELKENYKQYKISMETATRESAIEKVCNIIEKVVK